MRKPTLTDGKQHAEEGNGANQTPKSAENANVGLLYARKGLGAPDPAERGRSGKFSSDRAIPRYSAEIWKTQPCPVRWRNGQ